MISQKLADYICNLKYTDLPDEVIEITRLSFLDWLGSALAGAGKEAGQMVYAVAEDIGGNPQATLIPSLRKSSCLNAALVNGAVSHIVELDDVHKASILHAAAAIIPAALAAAEKIGASGEELITAIVAGYEVGIRIGEAVTPSHYYYWHNTGTCGTFGAAAAAGKILGLNRDQMVHALGNAGTQAAGLWEFLADGAMSKHLHPGKAAMNGLLAALLAARGFTGASKILEGEKGFCKATAREYDLNKITDGLGQSYKILENSFKIHASCRHTHPGLDLVIALAKQFDLTPGQVEKIVVKTYGIALDITGNYQPNSLYAAKFSLPFCVALGLKKRKAGLAEFNEAALEDKEIRELMSRVELVQDPEIEALYPEQWPAIVEIYCSDNRVYTERTNFPKGDPENPVTAEELSVKFRELAGIRLKPEEAERLLQKALKMENIQNIALFFTN
ncbi:MULTISPECIES: MmgE/PrpD family protein [Carboxydocella]|uniref:2-methylcitrate dehydratase PrpD n=2 Tax=Carboxydocella TaxID=178898 RepID=A0A1T4N3Q9_9FIRM|nr:MULTISPECIES: MmgE/PrpD family protein [Carboxydocella]AVX20900.1 2-methylcitrate dehydratase PrpD [Carboxydocella thermautotrophica]AVX31315.1 2-methylcitrate dehydratase PrpD [Carboxydocella thermautotrophica]SJZ73852.1 2-methylcitrate dehydratase PrpD [Carboxydocella sporoproducens DSM 16521]GAW29938.1 2-methylcitrate dehydratase [Carboxydocella sp. ULO1]GAW30460.1 2-methylcitrate dehydratase [Carboxydocella sp. JDF658]